MPTHRVGCTVPSCGGFFEEDVAWPGTISMVAVPRRVQPTCNRCHRDLAQAWAARLAQVAW